MKKKLEKLKMPMRKKPDLSMLDEEGEDQKSVPGADDQYGSSGQEEDNMDVGEYPPISDDMPGEEDSQEEESSESPAEEQMEQEGMENPEAAGPLAHVDDEELMAEFQKRGLLKKLLKGDGESEESPRQEGDDGSSPY